LEARGLLDCPIVGVAFDDWSVDDLREHANNCIVDCGEKLDAKVFDRLAKRFSYIQGDFSDDATYERLAEEIKGARARSSIWRSRPSLFG
jgi:glucose-6-phosphate 1-dehydrogenase